MYIQMCRGFSLVSEPVRGDKTKDEMTAYDYPSPFSSLTKISPVGRLESIFPSEKELVYGNGLVKLKNFKKLDM